MVYQKSISGRRGIDDDSCDFTVLKLKAQVSSRVLVQGQRALEGTTKEKDKKMKAKLETYLFIKLSSLLYVRHIKGLLRNCCLPFQFFVRRKNSGILLTIVPMFLEKKPPKMLTVLCLSVF